MFTFSSVLAKLEAVPLSAAWLLEEIAEKRGHQDLFTRQSPEQLKRLREHAMIESAVASNRIEGVEVDNDRVGTVLFGNGIMRDRDEEEVRGYRKALDLIHTGAPNLPLSAETICRLHALSRPSIWDSGAFRQKKCDIIQTYADGTSRVRFTAVAPERVKDMLAQSIDAYENTLSGGRVPPLIAVAAFNLDFLCIHPFRDGNGRLSRLLTLLLMYRNGFSAGKYISFENAINANKIGYYDALRESSAGWNDSRPRYFPFMSNFLTTLYGCYSELDKRFASVNAGRLTKRSRIEATVLNSFTPLAKSDICGILPDVSPTTVEAVLGAMVRDGRIRKIGNGRGSKYLKA